MTPPVPSGDSGTLAITTVYAGLHDHTGRLRIDHADPHVWIINSVLASLPLAFHPDVTYAGDQLTITGLNRTVTYTLDRDRDPGGRWTLATLTTP